jgi:NADPH:quinone reductase-like Zn-dependent oxidoreductase
VRAIQIQAFGSPDGLVVVDVPRPEPAAGEVRIAVEAIGVGGVDAVIRRGTLSGYGFQSGHVLGSEVAGTVEAVGVGVDTGWIGQRVWAFTGTGGGYVDHAIAAVDQLTALPQGLSSIDAAALGSAGPVARFALAHGAFKEGDAVLVRGAGGSLGIMAVQLAALGGAATIAVTTSSPERGARLRVLGATVVLDRSGAGDAEDEAADGYDVIFDVIAGEALPSFVSRLRPNGRYVLVGIVGGPPPAEFGQALMASFQQSWSIATFSLNTVSEAAKQDERASQFAAAVRGELRSVVHEVLPLESAASAHAKMDAGAVFGRIVLTP